MENEKCIPTIEIDANNNMLDVEIGGSVEKIVDDHNNLKNLPSINGVKLVGNLTTEDLKIETGSDIELITKLEPQDIEEELQPNQVYNGNAIHDLARLFGIEMESVKESIPKATFDLSCTISLTKMEVSNVSSFSEEIIKKRNEGYLVRLNCTFIENPSLKVVCILSVIDGNYVFFYPLIRGDIGSGMTNYLFRLGIGIDSATISAHDLSGGNSIDILTEFNIEETYDDNQVYNANAIHQLLELFVYEITMIQETVNEFGNRLTALETVTTELEEI